MPVVLDWETEQVVVMDTAGVGHISGNATVGRNSHCSLKLVNLVI